MKAIILALAIVLGTCALARAAAPELYVGIYNEGTGEEGVPLEFEGATPQGLCAFMAKWRDLLSFGSSLGVIDSFAIIMFNNGKPDPYYCQRTFGGLRPNRRPHAAPKPAK